MSRLRLAAAWLAAVGLAGAADEAFVHALRLPADAPELRALAQAWRERGDELRAALADADPTTRRGAARLAGIAGLPPSALLAAVLASRDAEAQRLALSTLREVDALPAAELVRLADPTLACLLLARQSADPLAVPAVATRIQAWLREPAACLAAAELCCARGTPAGCGPWLLAALAVKDPQVVETAHRALCVLTRTQRSLAVYAGHHELLVKDWRDALAAAPAARGEPAPELVALVADLPAPAALLELLGKGPAALAAVERAMEGVDKGRRRELAVAARLLARDVTPALWRALGEEGFAAMDAAQPRQRLAVLTRAAEVVRSTTDARGLLHLLSYADDRDPLVRAAAYDRLVRLSDLHKEFGAAPGGGEWRLADGKLFPPGRTLHRLRRSLATGSVDEQVSAMQFVAALKAGELGDDVAGLLLAPAPVVVDTALETLGHLGGHAQQGALLRLARDSAQPPARRVRVIEMLTKANQHRYGDQAQSPEPLATFERIAAGGPPLVATAARKAWILLGKDSARRRAALVGMLADPAQRAGALGLLRDEFATKDDGTPPLAALAVAHLRDPDPEVAATAADSLLRSFAEAKLAPMVPAWFDEATRADLAQPGPNGRRLALALRLGLIDRPGALAQGLALPAAQREWLGHALLADPDRATALRELARLMHDQAELDGGLAWAALRAAKVDLLLQRPLLEEIGAAGALDLIPTESNDTDHSSDQRTRTLGLGDGRILVYTARVRTERGSNPFGHDTQPWQLDRSPDTLTPPERVAELVTALDALRLSSDHDAQRAVLLAIAVARPLPASAEARLADDVGAWRLLAARDPALRARLAARANAKPPSAWELLRLVVPGQPDLAPAVAQVLVGERQAYLVTPLVAYLASLPAEAVAPHLPTLLANPVVARDAALAPLLSAAPLPLACLPPLVRTHPGAAASFAAFTAADADAIAAALAELDEAAVLGGAKLLRTARASSPAAFDPVLRRLVERDDARAAAWLRTGLPLAAGMVDLYERALGSANPDVWLVGAARGLKEGALDAAGFVARVTELPPSAQAKAALVATRYLAGKLDGEAASLARILATCPTPALASWIALLPPDPRVAEALAKRVGEPAAIGPIGFALDARLRADAAGWRPLVDVVVAAAGGRLDHLKAR